MLVPRILRDRVKSIDVLGTEAADVLPSSSVVLGVQRLGRISAAGGLLAPAGVTGLQETVRRYEPVGATTSILVRFTPLGAASLGVPVGELTDRSVALDDVLPPSRVRELVDRVSTTKTDADARAAVVAFLASLPPRVDPLVEAAMRTFDVNDGARVFVVARGLGISERQLERRFMAHVGLTPKKWMSLRRFERAVATMSTSTTSLTTAALDAGYYDQAHFNREFRRRTGESPSHALRRMSDSSKPPTARRSTVPDGGHDR